MITNTDIAILYRELTRNEGYIHPSIALVIPAELVKWNDDKSSVIASDRGFHWLFNAFPFSADKLSRLPPYKGNDFGLVPRDLTDAQKRWCSEHRIPLSWAGRDETPYLCDEDYIQLVFAFG